MATIKSIGILTSGGDAPGMNAAIRAVTRSAIYNGLKVYGIYRGYKGLVTDEIQEFKTQNVSNIIQMGGTILKTGREEPKNRLPTETGAACCDRCSACRTQLSTCPDTPPVFR